MKKQISLLIVVGLLSLVVPGCSHQYHTSQRERIEIHRSEPPVEVVKTFLSALSSSDERVLHRIAETHLYRMPVIREEILRWAEKSASSSWKEQFLKGGKAVVTLGVSVETSTTKMFPKLWLVDTSRIRGSYYAWRVIRFDPELINEK